MTTRRTRRTPAAAAPETPAPAEEAPVPVVEEAPAQAEAEPSDEEFFDGPGGHFRRELWKRGQEFFESMDRVHSEDNVVTAVHDVRVATRRLASMLGLAEELIGAKPIKAVRQELSAIRRGLGDLRDADVQIEYLEAEGATHTAMQGRLNQLLERRGKLVRKARKGLERAKVGKLARRLEGIDALVAALVESSEGWHECWGMLDRATADRFAAMLQQRNSTNPNDAESMHQLRIAFKKFRYRAEVVGQLSDPPRPAEHADAMKAVQKALGALQDVEVITRGLESFWWEHPPEREAQLGTLSHLLARRKGLLEEFYAATVNLDTLWHLPPTE